MMGQPWETCPAHAVAHRDRIATALPRIETARLVLRAPWAEDWPVLAPIWTTERAEHIGGPMSQEDGWLDFNQCVAGWVLRGFGALTIADRATGAVLGFAVLGHEAGDPEPELGWLLTEAAEGQGYATEAATAMLDLARDHLGPDGVVSYIAAANAASARVATKLGGAAHGAHPLDPEVAVWRYTERSLP